MLDEIETKAWAGAVIDDDPAGPDAMAEEALSCARRYSWPARANRLPQRLQEAKA